MIWNTMGLICLLALVLFGVTWGLYRLRRTQSELKASDQRYKDVLDSMEGGVWEVDTAVRYTHCSGKVQHILGYSHEEMIGKSLFDTLAPGEKGEVEKLVTDVLLKKKTIKHVEIWNTRKDGQRVCIMSSGTPLLDKNGEVAGFRGVSRDITVQKQIEDQLKESEEQYRTYFEENPSGTYILDPEGRLIACNKEFRMIFGFEDENQALGMSDGMLHESPGKKARFLEQIKTEQPVVGIDLCLKKVDGTKITVIDRASGAFDDKGNLKYIRGFLVDVTEQKTLQANLRQAQKMEAIGTLSSGIAHDFNNILAGIYGHSQLAQKNIKDPVKTKKYINHILKGAKRAADLIQQILTFSRQTEHEKHLLNISSIVKEALKLLRSSIPTTIEIRQNIFSNAAALADSVQIHQVIMNLCTNAYHAMRDTGGILTVELKAIEINHENAIPELDIVPGRYLELMVSDTGCGIEEDVLKNIFDPYFTTKKKGEGTGLGLAMVYGIVEDHRGGVTVENAPGQGSIFRVFLPIAEQEEKIQIHEEVTTPLLEGTERVMLADDEKGILTATRDVIEYYGYKVSIFNNGEQALKKFQKDPDQFDLILTDMTMPKMTGYELSKEALKIRPDLPIILWTGYNENISEFKALKAGIKKYIKKPVDSQTLLSSIRKVLDKKNNPVP